MAMMKVMRWPLRSVAYKKFRVTLCIHHLLKHSIQEDSKLVVDVKWRGPKRSLGPRFRSVKSDRSSEATAVDGVLEWEQEFVCECTFGFDKETGFQPWDVYLVVCKVAQNGSKQKTSVLGKTHLNLGDLAPSAGNARQTAKFPVSTEEAEGELSLTLNFEELRTINEHTETNYRTVIPCISRNISWDREEDGHDENRMKPIKSIITSKKPGGDDTGTDERLTPTSEESSQSSPDRFDSDSTDIYEDNEAVDDAEISITTFLKYGRIAGANMIIGRYHSADSNDKVSSWATPKLVEDTSSSSSDSDQTSQLSMKRMLSWRKRKLSFRSPRARGEPLLNKAYGDAGGDEIDWDRRQSAFASDNMLTPEEKKPSKEGIWDFAESFQVGSWENKELISRDGQMKLNASVFFASIDQRSESAAGEGACTALVAVVADWLHRYSSFMPSRAEFDSLIRDGSADWRKLCQDVRYRDGFLDGHFDLETVLDAGVRPLKVIPEKSFVGFFQPEGCDFLDGAMSFDGIWDEVERLGPAIYIVSWNDHFFVLKWDEQAVYIIDTLGERLFEGCNQAYVLKFDEAACLSRAPPTKETAEDAKASAESGQEVSSGSETGKKEAETRKNTGKAAEARKNADKYAAESRKAADKDAETRRDAAGRKNSDQDAEGKKSEHEVQEEPEATEEAGKKETEEAAAAGEEQEVCVRGSSACREFVKSFFAAVPLRELESDMKKGLVGKECIHKRLQVEFHFTELLSTTTT